MFHYNILFISLLVIFGHSTPMSKRLGSNGRHSIKKRSSLGSSINLNLIRSQEPVDESKFDPFSAEKSMNKAIIIDGTGTPTSNDFGENSASNNYGSMDTAHTVDWGLLTDFSPESMQQEMSRRRRKRAAKKMQLVMREKNRAKRQTERDGGKFASMNDLENRIVEQQQQLTENDLKKLARLIQEMQFLNDIDEEDFPQQQLLDDYVIMNDDDSEPIDYRMNQQQSFPPEEIYFKDELNQIAKKRGMRPNKSTVFPEYNINKDIASASAQGSTFWIVTPEELADLLHGQEDQENESYGDEDQQILKKIFKRMQQRRRRR